MGTIPNGKDIPLSVRQGTVPDVSGSLKDTFQTMVFTQILKAVDGYQAVEIPTNTTFEGVIQPFTKRDLQLKPEGERAWTWYKLWADPCLLLNTDDVVTYLGVQLRVMALTPWGIYNYVEYELVQDWQGAGPNPPPPPPNANWDGGGAFTTYWPNTADGGSSNVS